MTTFNSYENDEKKFKHMIREQLPTNYRIKKNKNQYSNVDFIVYNKENEDNVLFIELKSRSYDLRRCDTLFIGKNKLKSIESNYKNSLLVWENKIDNSHHWVEYTDDLLKSNVKLINKSYCYLIDKHKTNCDIMTLIEYIIIKLSS